MIKNTYEKRQFLESALCKINAKSNEDRSKACMSHAEDGMDDMASFGLFDGHLGAVTAEALASKMHKMVAANYRKSCSTILSNDTSVSFDEAVIQPDEIPKGISEDALAGMNMNIPSSASQESMPMYRYLETRQQSDITLQSRTCSPVITHENPEEVFTPTDIITMADNIKDPNVVVNDNIGIGNDSRPNSADNSAITTPSAGTTNISRSTSATDTLASSILTPALKKDALMCESIRKAIASIHEDTRGVTSSGSTAVSIFLQWESPDDETMGFHSSQASSSKGGAYRRNSVLLDKATSSLPAAGKVNTPVRVYCANVGDSRCVMLRSSHPKPIATARAGTGTGANNIPDVLQVTNTTSASTSTEVYLPEPPKVSPRKASEKTNKGIAVAHMMSEDHKLTLSRERQRIVNKTSAPWQPLPADASPVYLPERLRPSSRPPMPSEWRLPLKKALSSGTRDSSNRSQTVVPTIVPMIPIFSIPKVKPPSSDDGEKDKDEFKYCMTHRTSQASMVSTATATSTKNVPIESTLPEATALVQGSIFDWNYPPSALQSAAKSYIASLEALQAKREASLRAKVPPECDVGGLQVFSVSYSASSPNATPANTDSGLGNTLHSTLRSHNYQDSRSNVNKSSSSAARHPSSSIATVTVRSDIVDIRDGSMSTVGIGGYVASVEDMEMERAKQLAKRQEDKEKIALGIEPPIVHRESFIRRRTNAEGTVFGPEALYGRHNMSIMMTRSVGDRYGPRSCIALPEISAYTVPVNMHARFVLATDGVWDVVSLNDVRCCGLLKKFQDSRVLATHLASKALRRRERAGMRADDISVLVVDVNPHCFLDCGGERNGGGDSGDSTLMGGFRSGSGCAPGCTIA